MRAHEQREALITFMRSLGWCRSVRRLMITASSPWFAMRLLFQPARQGDQHGAARSATVIDTRAKTEAEQDSRMLDGRVAQELVPNLV